MQHYWMMDFLYGYEPLMGNLSMPTCCCSMTYRIDSFTVLQINMLEDDCIYFQKSAIEMSYISKLP